MVAIEHTHASAFFSSRMSAAAPPSPVLPAHHTAPGGGVGGVQHTNGDADAGPVVSLPEGLLSIGE